MMSSTDLGAIIHDELTKLDAFKVVKWWSVSQYPVKRRRASTWYETGRIIFYAHILGDMPEIAIRDTVRHEVAHIVAYEWFGEDGKGHGKWWRFVAEALGAYPRAASSVAHKLAYHERTQS